MSLLKRPDFESGRLLLIDCEERTLSALHKSLQRLGITALASTADAPVALEHCFAAVVELEHFASPQTLRQLEAAGVPLIALTAHETLSQIQRAIELGATALLNKPITQGSVYTTLMMAIGLQQRLAAERDERLVLQRRLSSAPLLAQALARLMAEHGIDEAAAYERLRGLSMRLNRSLESLCVELANDRAPVPSTGIPRGGR
ncbi:ANTAR domain-containing response regulator [Stutzerimonas azotifigens]|uniref:ANTAR domain-containing protein n=1 Tax=Stutzerimonas azotifigens TaxID=291995 RepID=A0ABR5YX73_9GAMM|nr:ANTAR domain-containing protein [Stutzerimonas azotifigens]MBA1272532.1 ANTAR domain-containing protein [Stutzerimonas azotifigens]